MNEKNNTTNYKSENYTNQTRAKPNKRKRNDKKKVVAGAVLLGKKGGGWVRGIQNRKAVAPEKMRSCNTISYPRVRARFSRSNERKKLTHI